MTTELLKMLRNWLFESLSWSQLICVIWSLLWVIFEEEKDIEKSNYYLLYIKTLFQSSSKKLNKEKQSREGESIERESKREWEEKDTDRERQREGQISERLESWSLEWILNGTLLEDTLGPALGRDERLSV